MRYDLADDLADEALISVISFGAKKYTENGWREVDDALNRYFGALRRHARELRRFLRTREPAHRIDAETGFPHSAQLLCNAYFMCAIDLALHQEDFDGAKAAAEAWKRWTAYLESQKVDASVTEALDQLFKAGSPKPPVRSRKRPAKRSRRKTRVSRASR